MTTDFAGSAATFPALVTAPSDGEDLDGASVQVPFQQLADRTAFMRLFGALNWSISGRTDVGSGTSTAYRALVGNGRRWLAVGAANGVETSVANARSADKAWYQTNAASGVGNFSANDVAWDAVAGLFIFVGSGGNIRTGTDVALTFTSRASGGASELKAVHTNSAGVTVAAGVYDAPDIFAVRATDGITYSGISLSGSAGDAVNSIASNGATFVAVGETSGGAPLIWRSTDSGATFAAVTPPASLTDAAKKVVWDGTRFVVFGDTDQVTSSVTGAAGTWAVATTIVFDGVSVFLDAAADAVSGVIVVLPTVGADSRLVYSADSGATWGTVPHAVDTSDANDDWEAIGFDGHAWALVNADSAVTPDAIHGAQSLTIR